MSSSPASAGAEGLCPDASAVPDFATTVAEGGRRSIRTRTPQSLLVLRTLRLATLLEDALSGPLKSLDLSRSDFYVLTTLRAVGPPRSLRPTDLADRLVLTSGGLSNVLKRLSRRGLIDRELNATDRRVTDVRLSAAGVALAEECVSVWNTAQARFFHTSTFESLGRASASLSEILTVVDQRAPRDLYQR